MTLRPRSLSGLIIIGYGLIALPLLLAVINASLQMHRLAKESEELVRVGVQGTQNYRLLSEHLTSMERNARLYQVLGDREHLLLYQESEARFRTALDELEPLSREYGVTGSLKELRENGERISAALRTSTTESQSLNAALGAFEKSSEIASRLSEEHRRFIDRGLGDLEITAREAQRNLALQTAAITTGESRRVESFRSRIRST